MQFIWEESDIIAGRRVDCTNGAKNGETIIGYNGGKGVNKWALIATCDGLIYSRNVTKKQLADHLNKYKYRPLSL